MGLGEPCPGHHLRARCRWFKPAGHGPQKVQVRPRGAAIRCALSRPAAVANGRSGRPAGVDRLPGGRPAVLDFGEDLVKRRHRAWHLKGQRMWWRCVPGATEVSRSASCDPSVLGHWAFAPCPEAEGAVASAAWHGDTPSARGPQLDGGPRSTACATYHGIPVHDPATSKRKGLLHPTGGSRFPRRQPARRWQAPARKDPPGTTGCAVRSMDHPGRRSRRSCGPGVRPTRARPQKSSANSGSGSANYRHRHHIERWCSMSLDRAGRGTPRSPGAQGTRVRAARRPARA